MSKDKTYNGWTNYETWSVYSWITNDNIGKRLISLFEEKEGKTIAEIKEHHLEFLRNMGISKFADDLVEKGHELNYPFSEFLKNHFCNDLFPLDVGMYSDLLDSALKEVNCTEIAKHLLGDENV